MLNKSLTKRNVFVGNLSYKVDQFVLKSVFETLVVNEQRHLLKVYNNYCDLQSFMYRSYKEVIVSQISQMSFRCNNK